MIEYQSEAIVLRREPQGEADSRVVFFTRAYGKIAGRAKSARKITSKLSAHLEPGALTAVRLVEKNGVQVADALRFGTISARYGNLAALSELLPDAEPDAALWQELTERPFSWNAMLKLLGWDPAHALCGLCGKEMPERFSPKTQEFFCDACSIDACSIRREQRNFIYLRDIPDASADISISVGCRQS